jgi:phosphonopyruvate decarboxylase
MDKQKRCIVLDGDGALLMRMGAMPTVGFERPENLIHVILDNGRHESTGGQATASRSIDLCAAAAACGYREVRELSCPQRFADQLQDAAPGPWFIRLLIVPGCPADLPRPTVTPEVVAERLRNHIKTTQSGAGSTFTTKAAEGS